MRLNLGHSNIYCGYVPFCRPAGPIDATHRPHCLVANNNPECSLEPDYRNVPRSNRFHTRCSIVAQLEFKKGYNLSKLWNTFAIYHDISFYFTHSKPKTKDSIGK